MEKNALPISTEKTKLLAIAGPTASGKSSLAIRIAREEHGEIISVDSRQVYRGMDIGTGKVKQDESPHDVFFSEGIRHHLIDIVNPEEEYNISHFLKDATEITMEIEKRGVLPLLCGGTGFWMETFLDEAPISSVPPDPTLRAELSKTPAEDLFTLLTTLDPNRAKQIDRHNPHRLIRAIEIARAKTAGPHTAEPPTNAANISHTFDICIIALCPPKENLDEKIRARLDERLSCGMVEEVQTLHEHGISWERFESFGLEYRRIAEFLEGKHSFEEMKMRLTFDILHYAKRQRTWLQRWHRRHPILHFVETTEAAIEEAHLFLHGAPKK